MATRDAMHHKGVLSLAIASSVGASAIVQHARSDYMRSSPPHSPRLALEDIPERQPCDRVVTSGRAPE